MTAAPRPFGVATAYPSARTSLPGTSMESGRYRLRFARNGQDLDAVLRLRYDVFNGELGEGLAESALTGRDEDRFDRWFHHLVIEERSSSRVVGTYRMQTAMMATRGEGFYSATEFDLGRVPADALDLGVEVGRACVAADHRNGRVLTLLWRGLAAYLAWNQKRYLFGCCSLPGTNGALGRAVEAWLRAAGRMDSTWEAHPLPGLACSPALVEEAPPIPVLPPLFAGYLDLGASVCGPPAIDRHFGTTDFLVLLDTERLDARTRRHFFQ